MEKQKIEKGDKPKKKPAAKVKATLRMEGDVRQFFFMPKNVQLTYYILRMTTTRELEHMKLTTTTISCKTKYLQKLCNTELHKRFIQLV